MQILLTEKEYDDLKKKRKLEDMLHEGQLQDLCTLAAKHVPIEKPWHHIEEQKFSPWGCVLDEESNPGYCDDCPVTNRCPLPNKRWSR